MPARRFTAAAAIRTAAVVLSVSAAILGATQAGAFDLTRLPEYKPQHQLTEYEPIRLYGSALSGLPEALCDEFRKFQPKARCENRFPSSDGWTSGMETGLADIGVSGREVMLTEYLSFNETFGFDPVSVAIATGAADLKGKTWAIVVFVNKDNPVKGLTLKQLDGIFGAERSGGYEGFVWRPERARSAAENIRTWDQLGLRGEWSGKEIRTYGYAFTGMTNYWNLTVFNGGDKWNPNYRQYIEYGTKMVAEGPAGKAIDSKSMLAADLSNDKHGIAWSGIPHAEGIGGIRAVALAYEAKGPFVLPTRETVQNRSYPLSRSVFMFIKRAPGQPVEAKVREFMRFILSRQGQQVVEKHNVYLPLTPEIVGEQLGKIL